jgi:DMSO reductase anchor subunit
MNAQQRTALYALAVAAGGVALIYGLLSSDEVDAWLRVVEAALALVTVIAPVIALRHVTPDAPATPVDDKPEDVA